MENQCKCNCKLQPIRDKIVVKRDEEPQKTEGGLYLPDDAKERPVVGTVLAVGEGILNSDGTITKLVLQPGDKVVFAKYSGNEFECCGEKYLLLSENEIFCVVKE
jgi:chaperonin GroES